MKDNFSYYYYSHYMLTLVYDKLSMESEEKLNLLKNFIYQVKHKKLHNKSLFLIKSFWFLLTHVFISKNHYTCQC